MHQDEISDLDIHKVKMHLLFKVAVINNPDISFLYLNNLCRYGNARISSPRRAFLVKKSLIHKRREGDLNS